MNVDQPSPRAQFCYSADPPWTNIAQQQQFRILASEFKVPGDGLVHQAEAILVPSQSTH